MFDNARMFIEDKQYKNPYIMKRTGKNAIIAIGRLLFIIGLSYLFLFPLLYMLVTTFQSPANANDPSVIWVPKEVSLLGIQNAWKYLHFGTSATLTGVITIFGTAASVVSCAMVGYGFARFEFPFKNLAFIFVVLTIIVPPQITIMSSYLNFRFFDFGIGKIFTALGGTFPSVNLLDTAWVFVLPAIFATGIRNGLYIFIFKQFFSGQPKDLEEAARIDGCGPFKTFVRIMVPLAGPAFTTVLLFSIVWHWNDYYSSSMYFVNDIKPISCMLLNLNTALRQGGISGSGTTPFETRMYLMGGALLTILPPLLLYLFAQKFFTESIERTGLVG